MAQEKLTRCNKCITMMKKILKEATKREVVRPITICEYDLEIQLWPLDTGFRARQTQLNIDQHAVL